jgi:hypothetical protein
MYYARAVVVHVAVVVAFVAQVSGASRQLVPPHAPYRHGHLVDVPYIVLAVQLPPGERAGAIVEYVQVVDYLAGDGFFLPNGAAVARGVRATDTDEEGWLLLPLERPCAVGETVTDVGLLTVCPPRDVASDNRALGCTVPEYPITPLYAGVPEEQIECATRRRAVRH